MNVSVSILGLYLFNPEIFKNLEVPEQVDKDVLIPELLSECSDFCLLYPDYDFMQMLIGVWSKKEKSVWEAMQKSVDAEYDPIENYNRYEDVTRKVKGEGFTKDDASSKRNDKTEQTSVDGRTSFNSNNFQDTGRVITGGESDGDSETHGTGKSRNKGEETIKSHIHGNIGVTTAPAMLREYRAISNFTVYEFIIDSFKNRFCIQIY